MEMTGFSEEYQVAELLGFSRTAFSQRKARGSVPVDRIATVCEQKGWDFRWITTGKISEQVGMEPVEKSERIDSISIGDYKIGFSPVLLEIIEILQDEPTETAQLILQILKGRKATKSLLEKIE